jgi:hypothetical protein
MSETQGVRVGNGNNGTVDLLGSGPANGSSSTCC